MAIRRLVSGILILAAAFLGVTIPSLSAVATGQTVTVGDLVATGNPARFTFPVTLSGFSNAKSFIVVLSTSDGDLDLPNTTGITAEPGYPDLSGSESEFGFAGGYAEIEAALSEVGFTPTDPDYAASIFVTVTEDPGGNVAFWPAGSRYYEFVDLEDGITAEAFDTNADGEYQWTEAKAAAESMTLFGLNGYLATITSLQENDFISAKTNAEDIWIGAGRRDISVFDANSSNPGLIFEWKTGPEAGTAFAQQSSNMGSGVTAVADSFNAWAGGEPNNYPYDLDDGWNENYVVTNWQGTLGEWNDLPNTALYGPLIVTGFLVEYGGTDTFVVEQANEGCSYESSDEGVPCLAKDETEEESSGGVRTLASTGTNSGTIVPLGLGALATLVVGSLMIARTRRVN